MKTQAIPLIRSRLRALRTGDPRSAFNAFGFDEILMRLGSPTQLLSSSAKTDKCSKVGVLNRILYLPSGLFCPMATKGCLRACLTTAGRMVMPTSVNARDRKAALYLEDQEQFLTLLRADLYSLRSDARREGLIPSARLNGTSDIPWEELHPELFEEFHDIAFHDYTKVVGRMRRFTSRHAASTSWPKNYHLTFSLSECNEKDAISVLNAGGNVAVVFCSDLPSTYLGYPVIDGDRHDARFLDPEGVIVGLSVKGVGKEDQTGFVKRPFRRAA